MIRFVTRARKSASNIKFNSVLFKPFFGSETCKRTMASFPSVSTSSGSSASSTNELESSQGSVQDSVLSSSTSVIVSNAHEVTRRIEAQCASLGKDSGSVTLVLVSKTKPAENIQALYDAGYRHFGENYFQELLDKAPVLPKDIKWHFIGHLQSSKSARLVREVPNLFVIETVDSIKLAGKLNNACVLAERECLDIYVQVDTSGEETKSGVAAEDLPGLVDDILKDCPRLRIRGLMTIGAPGDFTCFDRLAACAEGVQAQLDALASTADAGPGPRPRLQLSMGMSADYNEAIARGSSSVRVGSTIFGARL
jgi:pyridoxal phosphate enzyme (YggS family)